MSTISLFYVLFYFSNNNNIGIYIFALFSLHLAIAGSTDISMYSLVPGNLTDQGKTAIIPYR